MNSNADFVKDCLELFRRTEGNEIHIPEIGETLLFEEPVFGFASADDDIFDTFRLRKVPGRSAVRILQTW